MSGIRIESDHSSTDVQSRHCPSRTTTVAVHRSCGGCHANHNCHTLPSNAIEENARACSQMPGITGRSCNWASPCGSRRDGPAMVPAQGKAARTRCAHQKEHSTHGARDCPEHGSHVDIGVVDSIGNARASSPLVSPPP